MTLAHGAGGTVPAGDILTVVAALAIAFAYLAGAHRRQPRAHRWPAWRSASFVSGLALGVSAVVLPWPDDFRGHALQHLLLAVYAPLGLVFGAPVRLLLRNLPTPTARRLGRIAHRPPLGILVHPATAAVLHVGGAAAVMLTPLYEAVDRRPPLHSLVHIHYLLAGVLFVWSIAGPDPVGRRPSLGLRTTVLVVASAAHAVLAKLMYAHAAELGPNLMSSEVSVRRGAQLMYYGGDIAELVVAGALFAGWYRRRTRLLALERGRSGVLGAVT